MPPMRHCFARIILAMIDTFLVNSSTKFRGLRSNRGSGQSITLSLTLVLEQTLNL